MMKKMKRLLSIALTLVMILSMIPAAAAVELAELVGENGTINYVSFGASNANGYGLAGYLDEDVTAANKYEYNVYGYQRMPVGSYPYLIAKALAGGENAELDYEEYNGDLLDGQPFKGVHVDQLSMSSMRMEELRVLLDEDYNGDTYTAWRFYDNGKIYTGGSNHDPENKLECEKWFYGAGKLAAGQGLEGIEFIEDEGRMVPDATQEEQDEALAALRVATAAAVENADLITIDMGINNFGVYMSMQTGASPDFDETVTNVDPEIGAQYEVAKSYVRAMIAEKMPELGAVVEANETLIDSLAYALVGYCHSFDVVMEKIRALNPDATVVVATIQNLLTGLSMEFNGQDVPVGDLFSLVINAANTYTAVLSPYCEDYYYANVSEEGRVEFFVDQIMAYGGDSEFIDPDFIDCYNVYDNDLKAEEQITGMVAGYLAANVIQPGLSEIFSYVATIYGSQDVNELLAKYLADGETFVDGENFSEASTVIGRYVGVGAISDIEGAYVLETMKGAPSALSVTKLTNHSALDGISKIDNTSAK